MTSRDRDAFEREPIRKPNEPSHQRTDRLDQLDKLAALRDAIARVIVGQRDVVEQLLIGLIAGGHCLLEGVPGLGKTLLVRSLGQALALDFHRIQFTPDLMPSDIIGTEILEEDHGTGKRYFKFQRGPVFTNLLLADELNRTPPKTQSALLEAMQERTISYAGTTHALPSPFFVLATQNPLEQAGTYPLPEAQLDRFLLHIRVDYPDEDEERAILAQTTGDARRAQVDAVMSGEDVLASAEARARRAPRRRPARPGSRAWCAQSRPQEATLARSARVGALGRGSARGPVARARRQGARVDPRPLRRDARRRRSRSQRPCCAIACCCRSPPKPSSAAPTTSSRVLLRGVAYPR